MTDFQPTRRRRNRSDDSGSGSDNGASGAGAGGIEVVAGADMSGSVHDVDSDDGDCDMTKSGRAAVQRAPLLAGASPRRAPRSPTPTPRGRGRGRGGGVHTGSGRRQRSRSLSATRSSLHNRRYMTRYVSRMQHRNLAYSEDDGHRGEEEAERNALQEEVGISMSHL